MKISVLILIKYTKVTDSGMNGHCAVALFMLVYSIIRLKNFRIESHYTIVGVQVHFVITF